jgi:hypothetical protein
MYNDNTRTQINPRKGTELSHFELKLTGSKNMFRDNRLLVNRKMRSLLLSHPLLTPENQTSIWGSTSLRTYLTLQKNNVQFFQKVPLYIFNQIENYYPFMFDNIQFDFTNSFIDIVNPVANDYKSVFFNCQIEAL